MSSVEQKINIFRFELEQRVETERKSKIEQAEIEATEEINKSAILIDRQKEQIEERYKRLEQRNTNKILSEAKNKAQDMILKTRREVHDEFRKTVSEAVKAFLDYEQYSDYLIRSLKDLKQQIPEPQELIIYINPQDRSKVDDFIQTELKLYPVTFKDLPTSEIGGLMIRDHDERVNYDYSIRNLLTDNDYTITNVLRDAMMGA